MNNEGHIDVAIINRWFGEPITGPSERFRRYALELKKRGINLRVVAGLEKDLLVDEVIDGIPVHRVPVASQKDSAQLIRSVLRYFRSSGEFPDVIQLLAHSHWSALDIWAARLFQGVPFFYVATMMEPSGLKKHHGWAQHVQDFIRVQLSSQPLNAIVTSSQVMADRHILLGAARSKISVIPNGVDTTRFHPLDPAQRAEVRQRFEIGVDEEIVLFVGSIVQRKGVDILLAAWDNIAKDRPHTRLFLIGDRRANPAFTEKVDEMVRKSSYADQVNFLDAVPNVEEYMQAADLFVFPSRYEGMPNVVPEAMACGLPCIIMPFEGLPAEFGRPDQEYRLINHSAAELSQAAVELLANKKQRLAFSNAGASWVKEHLDVEISLDRYAELYRKLAGKESL